MWVDDSRASRNCLRILGLPNKQDTRSSTFDKLLVVWIVCCWIRSTILLFGLVNVYELHGRGKLRQIFSDVGLSKWLQACHCGRRVIDNPSTRVQSRLYHTRAKHRNVCDAHHVNNRAKGHTGCDVKLAKKLFPGHKRYRYAAVCICMKYVNVWVEYVWMKHKNIPLPRSGYSTSFPSRVVL